MVFASALVFALALAAPDRADDSMRHEQADKTVASLKPELLVYAHLYEGLFQNVSGVYCDPVSGEMYVTDAGRDAIAIFDDRGSPLFTFTDPDHLRGVQRAIVDTNGNIYVIDSDLPRIKVFSYRGEFLSHLELPGRPADSPELKITAIEFDADGNLYVGDSGSGQVLVFDPSFKQLKARIGKKGIGKGQLSAIVGIAVDSEYVYVADQQSLAVQVFTKYGRFLRGWGYHDVGTHNVSLPSGIAVDRKGRVVLIDTLRQEIKYFDPQGRMIDRFGGAGTWPGAVLFPVDVSLDRHGRLCVAERGNRRVQVLSIVEIDQAAPPPRPGRRASGAAAVPTN